MSVLLPVAKRLGLGTLVRQHAASLGVSKRLLASDAQTLEETNEELAEIFGLGGVGGLQNTGREGVQKSANAEPSSMTIEDVNAELDTFFGMQHVPQEPGTSGAERLSSFLADSVQPGQRSEASTSGLTHVDASGKASMVDVGAKANTRRVARASCRVLLGREAFALVASNAIKKGDVLTVAQIAGIQAAKHTPLLIPLCHNILLSKVGVKLELRPSEHAVLVQSEAHTVGQTGVEMEALTAASVAALTVYDMCKAVSKEIEITNLQLDAKSGGRSGDYVR